MAKQPTKPPRGRKKPGPPAGPPNDRLRKGAEGLRLIGGEGEAEAIREQLKLLQPIVDVIKAGNVDTLAVLWMGKDGLTRCEWTMSDHCTLASMADQFDDQQREFRDDVLHPEVGDE